MNYVRPRHSSLRQWVLTLPLSWRPALGRDGARLGSLTRIFEQTVPGFYARRAHEEGQLGAKPGSVSVLQRASSDLRLNPHVHAVLLDGAWYEQEGLVRILLKRPFPGRIVAVEMGPLSLRCRLAASVPPPRRHTVR
jgi:hypothetical protein